jgi:hypothetical protein
MTSLTAFSLLKRKTGFCKTTGPKISHFFFYYSSPLMKVQVIPNRTTIALPLPGCVSKGYFNAGNNQPTFSTLTKQSKSTFLKRTDLLTFKPGKEVKAL